MLSDPREDGSPTKTIVQTELKELICLGHLRALKDCPDTDIKLGEVLEGDIGSYGRSLRFGSLSSFVSYLGSLELSYLGFDDFVLDLLEEEARLTQLVPYREEVGAP